MKLRLRRNSIRLRLLRSEVERFAAQGRISEEVDFGESSLRYSLVMSEEADFIRAAFADNEITVLVPTNTGRDWATGNETGIGTVYPSASGNELSIAIEKDFVCLDRPDDPDRGDAFPNPGSECEL
ncbi:MAG TPA: hypothetical protein VFZ23_01230 [Pyrinomonadaceae bacterium]